MWSMSLVGWVDVGPEDPGGIFKPQWFCDWHLKFIVEIWFQLYCCHSVVIADHLEYFPDIRVFSRKLIQTWDSKWTFEDGYRSAVGCCIHAQPEQMIAWTDPAQMEATVIGVDFFFQFCSARKMQRDFYTAIFLILPQKTLQIFSSISSNGPWHYYLVSRSQTLSYKRLTLCIAGLRTVYPLL